ncbi:hypothetical protein IQ226_17970 [Dolichospermum sp. LEGE 00240]|uniref:hypothetical protein n=1 Tax=Dolichospermum sp. LEGE 00240 TaxID=1828603 RepID=UPI001880177C|nr:hypothetical protein [Dolichospermum sp. LEGE 00240]MBE9250978.1 hypothetical protein [Dolichospermum sp. LEGE 00240]MDM3848668.1 hypothetical protein [Aphanizomenon gracile PMC627.10]
MLEVQTSGHWKSLVQKQNPPVWTKAKAKISNWTKIFTVIAREGKQSQPWLSLDFTSFHSANATLTQ